MEIKKTIHKANKVMSDRRSIKRYDNTIKITKEELHQIIHDALSAPSSFNLQPWRFVVVLSEEAKKSVEPYMMFNQKQWETSAAIIAIFADLENTRNSSKIYTAAHQQGLMDEATKNMMIETIATYSAKRSAEYSQNTAVFDCGLITMQLMLSAKNYGYDTNAIGGFEREEVAKVLGMDTKRYLPLLLLSIGKAADNGHESVRFSVDDVTLWK